MVRGGGWRGDGGGACGAGDDGCVGEVEICGAEGGGEDLDWEGVRGGEEG